MYVHCYLLVQRRWRFAAQAIIAVRFSGLELEKAWFTHGNYTHADGENRDYEHLTVDESESKYIRRVLGAWCPGLKYYIADENRNCAYTNGGHAIGAPLSFASAKADVDSSDPLIPKDEVVVTNLDSTGAGSFRAACETAPLIGHGKVILFSVGGYINQLTTGINILHPAGTWTFIMFDTAPSSVVVRRDESIAAAGWSAQITLPPHVDTPHTGYIWHNHMNLKSGGEMSDSSDCYLIREGNSNIAFAYPSFGYANADQVGAYINTLTEIPNNAIENILFLRPLFADALKNGDGTGCHLDAAQGGQEGDEVAPTIPVFNSKLVRNFVFWLPLWVRCSHRQPLYGGGDPAAPENGGLRVINSVVYDYNGGGAFSVNDGSVADLENSLIVTIYSPDEYLTKYNQVAHLALNAYNEEVSLYIHGLKARNRDGSHVRTDWNTFTYVYYPQYYITNSLPVTRTAVPDSFKRANPLEDYFGLPSLYDAEGALEHLISDPAGTSLQGGRVGPFLPARTGLDERAITDVRDGVDRPEATVYASIEWDILS